MIYKKLTNFKKAKELVLKNYLRYSEDFVKDYREYFLNTFGESLEAVIFYGSCLNVITKKETSTPDFFLIAKSYYAFHKSLMHSTLNRFYTPNTYSLKFDKGRGKYNTISIGDLKREMSPRAKDIYNLGRLSKRTAVIYSRNDKTSDELIEALTSAYYTVADKVKYLAQEPFSFDKFLETALRISYVGEKRVEADDKIERLYKSEKDFYDSMYSLIIEDFISINRIEKLGDNLYKPGASGISLKLAKFKTRFFLKRSVIRAKLRWPKSMYTFKGWVDVLLAKIERTKGIKIELTEKERKYPLIYGWKYYFRLKRDKTIK